MKISILASIWSQNLWDELILKNEIKILEKKYFDKKINFRVFTYDISDHFFEVENVSYIEYFPIWIKDFRNIFRNIKNFFSFLTTLIWSDIVVIWWWGIFYDSELVWVSDPLGQWNFRSMLAKVFNKKIIIYWVSIETKKLSSKSKIKNIFSRADEIYVRNNSSANYLADLGITSQLILDPVFSDNGEYYWDRDSMVASFDAKNLKIDDLIDIITINNKITKSRSQKDIFITSQKGVKFVQNNKSIFEDKVIWIAPRRLWIENEIDNWRKIIKDISSKYKKIVFIPHSFHKIDKMSNDLIFINEILEWVDIRNYIICEDIKSSYEVYKIRQIDICIAERLHSMILCQVYDIPFVSLSYADKTENFLVDRDR